VKGLGEQLTAQNVRVVFKPFDIDELTAAIADALAHGAERATRASAAATDGRHRPGT
jgi:DNA-binding NtrC family response regulator